MERNISRSTAWFLTVTFCSLLVGVFCTDLIKGTYAELLEKHPPTLEELMNGSFGRAADSFLEEDSYVMRATRPAWNEFMLNHLNETPSKVVVGTDGFLFLRTSLQPVIEPTATRSWNDLMAMLTGMHQAMAPTGMKFRVLVMPAKWRFFENRMRGAAPGPRRRELYSRAITALRAAGIDAPDLLTPLKAYQEAHPETLLYPPTDTHLSRFGFAHVATNYVADLAGINPRDASSRLLELPMGMSQYHGDLLRVLSIRASSSVGKKLSFAEEVLRAPACFDKKGADILVLGDSFFRTYDGLFQRLIQQATGMTVDSRYAGWRASSMPQLFADYGQNPAHIVLIAFTERRFATL